MLRTRSLHRNEGHTDMYLVHGGYRSCKLTFLLLLSFGSEQNEAKHDSSTSPGMTDQEKEMAASAYEAFSHLSLTGWEVRRVLKHLEALQDLNKEDYKIAMNKAVVEFIRAVHTSAEDVDGLDDVENSLLYYNQAIIHYHMRQYSEAISIGEKLYQFLEPLAGVWHPVIVLFVLEEKFAQAVCFLLVVVLLTFQPEKALHLLAVLDKLSVQGSNKNGKGENNSSNKDGAKQKAEFTAMIEAAKSKMHQYKVRAYIQMKSSKACKREIKSVMNTAGNVICTFTLPQSNFEYLRGNYRKAVKLLNSSNMQNIPDPSRQVTAAAPVRGQDVLRYAAGECVRCMFWNNLGCIHFAMGKHNLGIFYFKKALQENDHTCAQLGDGNNGQSKKFTGIPMCALLANKRYELLYNCGIQLATSAGPGSVRVSDGGRTGLSLQPPTVVTARRVLHLCQQREQESKGIPCKKGIVQSIVGQGYHRKIVLASQSTQHHLQVSVNSLHPPINHLNTDEGQSAAIPVASMEFAAICLRNALLLLPEHQQDTKTENGSKSFNQSGSTESGSENSEPAGQEADKFLSAAPSSPLRKQEVLHLACSAYVALALGDNLMALNHAEKLLHQTKVSGSLKFLGHLYAAEASSHWTGSLMPSHTSTQRTSDKGDEPVESCVPLMPPPPVCVCVAGKQTPLCYPSSVTSARAMMLFNLGSAYCLRSEYDKARKCLHQAASMVNTKEIPPEAILLGVYLELQNGNTQLALQIIKRNQLLPTSVQRVSPDSRKKP
ncbi:hypothetical protein INR49_003087, partial [Caranx melampygus]